MQGVFNFYLSYFFVFLKKKFFYGLDDNFMGHDHSHTGHQHEHGESTRNLGIAFFLNLGFAIIEIIGGLWTNSVAIISDAVHDFGDAFSIGVSYFLERYSNRKRTVTFTYGYKRFSTLGALINSIVLLVGAIIGLIALLIARRGMNTVKSKGSATDYVRQNTFRITGRQDIFLYSNVTKTRRDTDSGSSAGHSGGGSSVHTSSSGHSHGGGGGHF